MMSAQIIKSDAQAIKALLRIHAEQTAAEKKHKDTNCNNRRGFTKADARIMTSFADFYRRNNYLSVKQLNCVKRRIEKYAGQIVNLSISDGFIKNVNGIWASGLTLTKMLPLQTVLHAVRKLSTKQKGKFDMCKYCELNGDGNTALNCTLSGLH